MLIGEYEITKPFLLIGWFWFMCKDWNVPIGWLYILLDRIIDLV